MAARRTVRPALPAAPPGGTPTERFARGAGAQQAAIAKAPALQMRSLGRFDLSTTPLTLPHGLGRVPSWLVADPDAAATVHRTAIDAQTLTLVASGAVSVEVWVW